MITKAVIPAAGLGTRLLPITKSQPKEMLPLGSKPCIQYIVEELGRAATQDILFVTGQKKRAIEDHFDTDVELNRMLKMGNYGDLLDEIDFEALGQTFFYTRQRYPAGLGDAISYGRDFTANEPFYVALGDSVIYEERPAALLERMTEVFRERECSFVIAVEEVEPEDVRKYGIVSIGPAEGDDIHPITDLVEKPPVGMAPSNLAIAARYIFDSSIYDALQSTLPDSRGEIQLTNAIRILLKQGKCGYAVRMTNGQRRYDIGNMESYYKAFLDFALRDERYGYSLRQYINRNLGKEATWR